MELAGHVTTQIFQHDIERLIEHSSRGLARVIIVIILKDRKSTRLNSSHANISYAVFCLKKKTLFVAPAPIYLFHVQFERLYLLLPTPTLRTSLPSFFQALSHTVAFLSPLLSLILTSPSR